jgi:5-methylcytosine-specific restriction endonuclease McrA
MTNPLYRTMSWKYASRACLERDGFRCRVRLPGCRGRATTADHVHELEDGGALYDLGNLQAACTACNTAKRNSSSAARAKRSTITARRW